MLIRVLIILARTFVMPQCILSRKVVGLRLSTSKGQMGKVLGPNPGSRSQLKYGHRPLAGGTLEGSWSRSGQPQTRG